MSEINGKAVEFADRLPARQWWGLYPKVLEVKQGDNLLDKLGWDTSVEMCRSLVTSWEFDGDPQDAGAYEQLDFIDMVSLVKEAFDHAIGLMARKSSGDSGLGE